MHLSLNEDDIDESLKRPLQNYGDSSKYDLSNTYQTVSSGGLTNMKLDITLRSSLIFNWYHLIAKFVSKQGCKSYNFKLSIMKCNLLFFLNDKEIVYLDFIL